MADDDSSSATNAPLARGECLTRAAAAAEGGDLPAAMAWCDRALAALSLRADDATDDEHNTSNDGVHQHATGSISTSESEYGPSAAAAASVYAHRAEYALAHGDWERARADAERALGLRPGRRFPRALRTQCRALVAMGQAADARATWLAGAGMDSEILDELMFARECGPFDEDDAKALDVDATALDGYEELLGFFYRRDYGNCISLVTRRLAKSKAQRKDPVLFLLRGRSRMALLQDTPGAAADFERVIALLPTAVEGYRWLVEALIAMKRPKDALRACHSGLRVAPTNAPLRDLQASLDGGADRPHRNARSNNKKKKTPSNTGRGTEDGAAAEAPTENEDQDPRFVALRQLKQRIKRDPRNAALHRERAGLRIHLEQFDLAQADAEQAIALDREHPHGYCCSCAALFGLRRFAKAKRVCESGLVPNPEHPELMSWSERIEKALVEPPPHRESDTPMPVPVQRQRVPKAVTERRRQKEERRVTEAQTLRVRAFEKAEDLADGRDFGNAVYWISKAMGYADKEQLPELYTLRARCRFELKQFELVREDAERAIAIDPTDAESFRWLAMALKAMGRKIQALDACHAGLALVPDHRSLLAIQRALSGVQS